MLEKPLNNSIARGLISGCVVLFLAIPLAFVIHLVNYVSTDNPERGIVILAAIFAIILVSTLVMCWILRIWRNEPSELGLVFIATICVILISIY